MPQAKPKAPHDATAGFAPTTTLIEAIGRGEMVILADNEDRENEGDLVIAGQHVDAAAINFMAKFGRGLVCLALDRPRVQALGLSLIAQSHNARHDTAFTTSIEARTGITTGISAADRARTVAIACDPSSNAQDIATPGHVFPLLARDGGVLERAGHTEAALDLTRLAGLNPGAVICEIMNDDGQMARRDDLLRFAQTHELKVGTIADLVAHRLQQEALIRRHMDRLVDLPIGGEWRLMTFINVHDGNEHAAFIKGEIRPDHPTLVRIQRQNILQAMARDRNLNDAFAAIDKQGRGVVVVIHEPPSKTLGREEKSEQALREVGIGAQILREVGVRDMILLTNTPRQVMALDGFALNIIDHQPLS
ncbi:MAG: 3,4-dihydroxy-2-butanone-4-phosphate synthase [Pseudomonadota bacterium]